MKKIRYFLEGIAARILFIIFNALPYRTASNFGGILTKLFFIHSKRSRIAKNNINLALPDISAKDVDSITRLMWDNLGRNIAELPHISKITNNELWGIVSVSGEENIIADDVTKHGALFFTAHLGNWEIAPRVFSALGHPVNIVYRKANNPSIERMVQKARSTYVLNTLPKGADGSRAIIKQLRNGHSVGMLVDQKMNDGIKIDFFGHQAMTAPAIARLAIKFKCPVIPVRVCRYNNSNFKVTVYPHLELPNTNNRDNDVIMLMNSINLVLEDWIKEEPGQWIWMHNRWS